MNSDIFNPEALQILCQLGIDAALKAGKAIQSFDRNELSVQHKTLTNSLSSQVVTKVDLHCEKLIAQHLQQSCIDFDLAFLSEESANEAEASAHARHQKKAFWCIDPLDGTLPFIEGKNGYAVSIALVGKNGRPLIAVVYQPASDTLYHALLHQGIFKQNRPWGKTTEEDKQLHIFLDRSFQLQPLFDQFQQSLNLWAERQSYNEVIYNIGAGGVINACSVLEKKQACYVKFPIKERGGGSLWDFAASACLFQEARKHCSNINLEALDLNRVDSHFMNHEGIIFASNNAIAKSVAKIYRQLTA